MLQRANTLLKCTQRVSRRLCQGRAIFRFLEQWLFTKSRLRPRFPPSSSSWRAYFAHIPHPPFRCTFSRSPSTPPMSAPDLGALPCACRQVPQAQAARPGTTLLLSPRQVPEAGLTLLGASSSLRWSDLSSERRDG